jgi:cytochrome c556
MKMMKTIAFLLAGALIAGAVYAQFAEPEKAIAYRKSVMVLIAHHFKSMGAVVQGKAAYDKNDFAANAKVVSLLATLPWEATLTPGTDKGDTTLSPDVFSKEADFRKAATTFETATAKLTAEAMEGDLGTIKAGFGAVAKNCKACHSAFRKR